MPEPKQADPGGSEPSQAGVRSGVATTLYRFYDAADNLLYVGITSRGPERWRDHEDHRAWWAKVARSTTEHYQSRPDATDAERQAIQTEKPLHNVVHTGIRSERSAPVYRRHGQGSLIYQASRDRWAAVTYGDRRWFRFRTREQAEAFLDAVSAASDPDVRAALLRVLE